jgi:hypothetical protein
MPFAVRQQTNCREGSMRWYVSFRTGGTTIMQIFRTKEQAVEAACVFLDAGHRDALEVGPMLGLREGHVLNVDAIRQARQERKIGLAGVNGRLAQYG